MLSLGFNILVPVVLLSKGNDWLGWSPAAVLAVALAFPVGYGLYDYLKRRKANLFSIIGFVSILLTGGIGLLALPKEWIVVKETAIPLILGLIILGSQWTRFPLVEKLLMNREMFKVDMIRERLKERGTEAEFSQVMRSCGWLVAVAFFISAALNLVLALWIVQSESGTAEFNAELGKLQWVSFLVITGPAMGMMIWAFLRFAKALKALTGLELEEAMVAPPPKEAKKKQ